MKLINIVYLQLVAIPKAVPVQQSETVKPKSPSVAINWSKPAGELHVYLDMHNYL